MTSSLHIELHLTQPEDYQFTQYVLLMRDKMDQIFSKMVNLLSSILHFLQGLVLEEYLNACYADVCARDYEYMDGAACSSIAAYVQECSRHFGGPPGVDWRTDEICCT